MITQHSGGRGTFTTPVWYVIALIACGSLMILNSGALYYFDTASYLEQGKTALFALGLFSPEASVGAAEASGDEPPDGIVIGSRSAVYSVMMAMARFTIGVNWIVLLHSAALILAVWVPARVAVRKFGVERTIAQATVIPILVGCAGSLPFYTSFLMPDIFAPILLLVAASLATFARDMRAIEFALVLGLGVLAVLVHPSHLLIAVLMIPLAALTSLFLDRKGWWIAPLCLSLIVGAGFAERVIFAGAVKTIQSSDVVYQPFLTVRTIADGPGYEVLETNCPEEGLATCLLFDALQTSSNPYRLTATHIMFESSQDLGSYQLLTADQQKLVADEQISFFLRVLKEKPFALIGAFMQNTLVQANLYGIGFTIPDQNTLNNVHQITDIAPDSFAKARFLDRRAIFSGISFIHSIVYAISALLVIVIVVLPQQAPPLALRGFAMMLFVGVLVNAFVCGGVSQPADRYGARVAFLLPMAASFLILFYSGVQKRKSVA